MTSMHSGSHADLLAQNAYARQNSVREILRQRVAAKEQRVAEKGGELGRGAGAEGRARGKERASETAVSSPEELVRGNRKEEEKDEEEEEEEEAVGSARRLGASSADSAALADAREGKTSPLTTTTATSTPTTPTQPAWQKIQTTPSCVPKWWVISIKVVRAQGLAKVDWGLFSKSDPYVQVMLNGQSVVLTSVIHRSLNPVWNLRRDFDLHTNDNNNTFGTSASSTMENALKCTSLDFRVFDEDFHETAKPTFLGRVKFEGKDLVELCRLGQEGKTMTCRLVADPSLVPVETQNKNMTNNPDEVKEFTASSVSSSSFTTSGKSTRKGPRFRSMKKSRTVGGLVDLVKPRGKLVVQASIRLMSGVHKAFYTPMSGSGSENVALLGDDTHQDGTPFDDWGQASQASVAETASSLPGSDGYGAPSTLGRSGIMKTPERRARVWQRFQHASANAASRGRRSSPRTPKMQLVARQEMRERDRKTALDECERDMHAFETELRIFNRVAISASIVWHFTWWWQWDTGGMSAGPWLWGHCVGAFSFVFTLVACFLARQAYHSVVFDQVKTKRVRRLAVVERAHVDTKKMEVRLAKKSKLASKQLKMSPVKRLSSGALQKTLNLRASSGPASGSNGRAEGGGRGRGGSYGHGGKSNSSSPFSSSTLSPTSILSPSDDTRRELRGSQIGELGGAFGETRESESNAAPSVAAGRVGGKTRLESTASQEDDTAAAAAAVALSSESSSAPSPSSAVVSAGEKTQTGEITEAAIPATAALQNPYDPASLDAWRGTNLGDPYLQSITTSETKNLNLLIKRIRHLGKYFPYLDRLTALRFLRARDNDVDKAEEMFRNMVAWYDANDIAAIARDPYPKVTGMGQTYDPIPFYPGGQAGRDRDGDPVLWGRQGLADTVSVLRRYTIVELQREAVRRYETTLRMHRDDAAALGEFAEGGTGTKAHFQLTAILDVKGLGWKHTDSYGFKLLKAIQDLAREYYPELLKRALIVRPPRVFSLVWAGIRWFIDPKTRDKIVIASGTDAEILQIIEEHIERKYIPDYLGGDMVTRGLEAERAVRREREKEMGGGEEKNGVEEEEEELWIEGLQEDGKVFKATISEGGVIPERLLKYVKYKRPHTEGEEVMLRGDPSLKKYHENEE